MSGVKVSYDDASLDQSGLHRAIYHIYRDDASLYIYHTGTSYTDTDVVIGTTYSYKVKLSAGPNISTETYLSNFSPDVSFTTPPNRMSLQTSVPRYRMEYPPVLGRTRRRYFGYRILRKEGARESFEHIVENTGSADTAYTDDTVSNHNVSHTYRVRALNAAGWGRRSQGVSASVPYVQGLLPAFEF